MIDAILRARAAGRPAGRRRDRARTAAAGFTLIEVLVALGIFLGAMLAVLGIYFQNLRLARMAEEEIVVSMIQRDIMARNHVRASARAGQARAHRRAPASCPEPAPFDRFGSPRDGTPYGTLGSENTDPDKVFDSAVGWGVRNVVAWEKASGLHWGSWTRDQATAAGYASVEDAELAEAATRLYHNFHFIAHPVWRYADKTEVDADGNPKYTWIRDKAFEPATDDEWRPSKTSGHRGIALEDSQFTDWDGYFKVDMDGDGYPETERGRPFPSPGPIHGSVPAGFPSGSNTYDDNPYRIFYNSDKMGRYFMRIRVRIMWQVKNLEDVFNLSDQEVKAIEDGDKSAGVRGRRVFNHNEYYFSVVNPDQVKRWRP